MIWINKKIVQQLENSELARNDYKKGYIEFIKSYYCENNIEANIIDKVLNKALNQSSYQRQVAHIMNKLNIAKPSKEIQIKRDKHRVETQYKYSSSNLFESLGRYFNNITK